MIFRRLILLLFLLGVLVSFAQPGGGPGGGGDPGHGQPVPFSGLYFLIASGIVLGINKLRKKNK